jgi:hypothetical protein
MIVYHSQIEQLNKFFYEKFIIQLNDIHRQSNREQLNEILTEAKNAGFEEEEQLIAYTDLYFKYLNVFQSKPAWLVYVLRSQQFEPAHKLNHIRKMLSS